MSEAASSDVTIYLDEHINPAITTYLRTHGIDVLTALEAGRANQRIPDFEQLDFATSVGRVLVSRDADFLNPSTVPQLNTGQHAGIVTIRRTASIGEQARYLRYIAETETMETMAGQIRYYEQVPKGLFSDD